MTTQPAALVRQTSSQIIAVAETIRQNLENVQTRDHLSEAVTKPGKGKDKVKSAIDNSEKFRQMEEHRVPIGDLLRSLDVESADLGLSEESARRRLEMEGPNALTEQKPTHWSVILIKDFTGVFALMLWVAATLCFIVYGLIPADPTTLYTACVILAVILGVGFSSFYQEMKSRSIMASFKSFTPALCQAIRGGQQSTLKAVNLVRGDIVLLRAGDRLPADIRIITATDMKVDNASLTGESEPQKRKAECTNPENPFETQNLAFFGTSVVDGTCTGVVIFTGDSTFMGRIANLAGTASSEITTLQREINFFVKLISAIAISLGILFLGFGIYVTRDVLGTLSFCIGVIVANTPEGLMTSLTVVVSLCAKRMAEKHVLVKNLQSVETLGSITAICWIKLGLLQRTK